MILYSVTTCQKKMHMAPKLKGRQLMFVKVNYHIYLWHITKIGWSVNIDENMKPLRNNCYDIISFFRLVSSHKPKNEFLRSKDLSSHGSVSAPHAFSWLGDIAPCFGVNGNNVQIIDEPKHFHEILKVFIIIIYWIKLYESL